MKFVFLLLLSLPVLAQVNCGPHLIRVVLPSGHTTCMSHLDFPRNTDPFNCYSHTGGIDQSGFNTFYGPSYRGGNSPWWAGPAHMTYPNVSYPGAWNYPFIDAGYYPGAGQVFAAKPNVYVDSIHADKDFEFAFTGDKLSFLATTPPLIENRVWKGKIADKDKFDVEGIYYDYLFYDVRLPKEKMQFERGQCTSREAAIDWMISDLKAMNYSLVAIQDFEEHWRVKIPDYPYYCIYPQYNNELDPALPVTLKVDQATFTRALYVLVPFKKEPSIENALPDVPFPRKDPAEFRPSTKITREVMFREWGVAFLGAE